MYNLFLYTVNQLTQRSVLDVCRSSEGISFFHPYTISYLISTDGKKTYVFPENIGPKMS